MFLKFWDGLYQEVGDIDSGKFDMTQRHVILMHYAWELFAIVKYPNVEVLEESKYWQPFKK